MPVFNSFRRSRSRSAGRRAQAIVEFALVLPVAVVILAVAATGGQMLAATIDLTQAARAGATVAQSDYSSGNSSGELADARNAVDQELGVAAMNCAVAGSVPPGCVSVNNAYDSTSGEELITVTVWQSVAPFVPVFGSALTVSAHATGAYSS